MAEIAVAVLEPNGTRWAQLLENQDPIRNLIQLLVARLELPKELKYQLISVESGHPLGNKDTLESAGIVAGAELMLKPVADPIFAKLRDRLYKEAKKRVEKKMLDEAKSLYEELRRIDPQHPDLDGLERQMNSGRSSRSARSAVEKSVKPPSSGDQAAKPAGQTKTRAGSASRFGCGLFAILSAGTMFLVVLGAIYLLLSDGLPEFGADSGSTGQQLGTGDVQVTLRWSTAADIDLSVVDPFGEEIWFNHRTSNSGGELDVDANADCMERKLDPVENVYWPTGLAPSGEYQVYVNYFAACENAGPTRFEVVVKIDTEVIGTYADTINPEDGRIFITNFTH
jgi:hypothetical protein